MSMKDARTNPRCPAYVAFGVHCILSEGHEGIHEGPAEPPTPSVQAALDEGTRQRRKLLDLLTEVQWCSERRIDYDITIPCCPICGGIEPIAYDRAEGRTDGGYRAHEDDCRLAKEIGAETRSESDG